MHRTINFCLLLSTLSGIAIVQHLQIKLWLCHWRGCHWRICHWRLCHWRVCRGTASWCLFFFRCKLLENNLLWSISLFVYYVLLSSLPSYLHTIYWHCHILLLPPILLAWLAISISVIWQFIWPIRFLFIQSWHWQQKLTGKIKKKQEPNLH